MQLDDLGLAALGVADRRDLLDIVNLRHCNALTLVAGQVPPEQWHPQSGNRQAPTSSSTGSSPTFQVRLTGDLMRPTLPTPKEAEARAGDAP